MSAPALTWLYVPGDRPDRIAKALGGPADVVIVDLEDAVAPNRKANAREAMRVALGGAGQRRAEVRVNGDGSPWHDDDLDAVRELGTQVGVRLPKAESPVQVRRLAETLGGRALHLLVESALGVEHAFDLAGAHESVATIALGEADLRASLSVTDEDGLAWARGRVVNAAAAAGLRPPPMSVYPHVRDLGGLAHSCQRGRALGFLGRTAIHPAQLPVIREAFLPAESEVRRARDVLTAARSAVAAGSGAVALADGRFVDAAVLRQARTVLAVLGEDA